MKTENTKIPVLQIANSKEKILKQKALNYENELDLEKSIKKAKVNFDKILLELQKVIEERGEIKIKIPARGRDYRLTPDNKNPTPHEHKAWHAFLSISNLVLPEIKRVDKYNISTPQKELIKEAIMSAFRAGQYYGHLEFLKIEKMTVTGAKRAAQREKSFDKGFGSQKDRDETYKNMQRALDFTYQKHPELKSYEKIYDKALELFPEAFLKTGKERDDFEKNHSFGSVKKHCSNPRTKK